MNTVQRIAKNTAALFAAQFVTIILGLVLSIYIARILGDVIFGKYSFALAFVAIFAVFSDLGYNTILIREVSRDKSQARKYLNNVISMRILLSIAIFALIVVTINLMDYPADTKNAVYLFGIYTLLTSISAVFKVTFRAFEKMEYEAAITILANIIRTTMGLSVLFLGYGLIELALIFVFSAVLEVLFSILVCSKKFIKPQIEFDLTFWKNSAKIALPLSITGISLIIYTRTDTIMLSAMKGDAAVGWYNAAYNLVLGFKPIPQLMMNALFPLMSRYCKSSKDSLNLISELSFKILFILGLPIALGMTILADKIIHIFYGIEFINSVIVLQILAWDIFLFMLWTCGSFILVAADKQKIWVTVAVFTAFINIAANLVLIPPLSYIGAAFATIIAEILCLILIFYFIKIKTRFNIEWANYIKVLFANSIMGVTVYYFQYTNLFILIFISMLLYFIILLSLRVFSKDETNLLLSIFSR